MCADFESSVSLTFEIDDASARAARATLEDEFDDLPVSFDSGRATGGRAGGIADGGIDVGTLTELQTETVDLLDDILDELETVGVGGGDPGGLPIPDLGGGDGDGFSLLEALGIGSLAKGGGGGRLAGLLSRLNGPSAAATALFSGQFGRGSLAGPGNRIEPGPVDQAIASGFNAVLGRLSNIDVGAGGVSPGAGGPGPDVGGGTGDDGPGLNEEGETVEPSPEFQSLIEQFDEAVSQTPAWLSDLTNTVDQLTTATTQRDTGVDRTEGGDLRLSRLAGNPSGATGVDRTEGGDRRLARAAANQRADNRADRGPTATRGRPDVNVSVEADGVDRREVERAMDEAKQEAVREIEQQFRESQRRR